MNQNIRGAERRMSNEEFRFWDEFPALQLDDPQGRKYNDLVTTLRNIAIRYWTQWDNKEKTVHIS